MAREFKTGIIGCGGIANGKHMPSLKKLDNVKMVAFCDIVKERAEKAAKEFGVPDAKVYTDYHEMLKDSEIDVIHVCTPNKSHAPITIASLEAGKHVMCEKPMAKTAADAQAMLDAAKRTGKKLTIGYQNRSTESNLYAKAACQRGDLGEIYFAKAHAIRRRAVPTWGVFLNEEEQGGGPLIDIGTHALDLTLWMMDNYKPKMVVGTTYRKLGDQKDTGNAWGDWDPKQFTVEDSAFGFIVMENGATIVLESSWALNTLDVGEACTTLCGDKAGLTTKGGLKFNKADLGKLTETTPAIGAAGVAFFSGTEIDPALYDQQQWYNAIENDTDPLVLPEQALVVSQILEAIYESAKTGKPVMFS